MARRDDLSLKVEGLAKLRRDLRAIDKDLGKSLTDHLRDLAREVRDDARSNLRERSKDPQNRIEKTIKHSVKAKGASVFSDHPGAAVQNYGGTIAPKGTPIEIKGKSYMDDAVHNRADHVKEQVEGLLDGIADRNGFH